MTATAEPMQDSQKRNNAFSAGFSAGFRLAVTMTTSTVIAESLIQLFIFKEVQISDETKIDAPIPTA